ncbi:hypothetical protein SPN34_19925 [Enterobacter hormaechei subsp. xiangfangensis]
MITFTKEQLIASAHARIEFAEMMLAGELEPLKERTWSIELELARIALASLEAEPVACHKCNGTGMTDSGGVYPWGEGINVPCDCSLPDPELSLLIHDLNIDGNHRLANVIQDLIEGKSQDSKIKNSSPPEPVSLPDELAGKSFNYIANKFQVSTSEAQWILVGWNACRAAMLQGAEPVTTANKLPFEQWLSQQTGTIDVECGCVMTEVFFHWLRVAYEAGNSPVIPDGWVMVPKELTPRMITKLQQNTEIGSYIAANWAGAYGLFQKFWDEAIAAAPQQEVK